MNPEELTKLDSKYKATKNTKSIFLFLLILSAIVALSFIYLYSYSSSTSWLIGLLLPVPFLILFLITHSKCNKYYIELRRGLETGALGTMNISDWMFTKGYDAAIQLKSARSVEGYDEVKFFKEHPDKLNEAATVIRQKKSYSKTLTSFLENNGYKNISAYPILENIIQKNLQNTNAYNIGAVYISPAGRSQSKRIIPITEARINQLLDDKSILMTKGEYNKYVKEQERNLLDQKHHSYYEKVNNIIDLANKNKDALVIDGDTDELDKLIASLFDRTVNSIKKIKSTDSEEWDIIDKFISNISDEVNEIIDRNRQITNYYESDDFIKLKSTCDALMSTQKEFNEYIDEKVNSITNLFGTNVVRNETTNEDVYEYIHPYKKSITPFTAEVSANVFASAENNPLEYVVKNFYPDKARYPEQIQKLQLLIEELETLKEAKQIIENYKNDIQQYLTEVPDYVMKNDESGFYSRLGFATISEKALTVEYKFSYTSNGGYAQRSFTIPMTEDTIIRLIDMLESKLTMTAFTKEQRSLMTSKLRQKIKERDDYTCKICGNSTHSEPNLLLEIDHIIPVSKGGCTEENNLQTLCWKCNRHKSSNIL